MDTIVKQFNEDILELKKKPALKGLVYQIKQRETSPIKWFDDVELSSRFSGTLHKSRRLDLKVLEHCRTEALAQTLGFGFEMQPSSRVTFNNAISEGDCHAVTETCWHIDRMISSSIFPEDVFETKYIIIDGSDGERIEGLGVVLKETSIQWIPTGYIVLSIIAEYDNKNKKWLEVNNPF